MEPKIKVQFYITSDNVDLNYISNSLDLQPTETREKKDWPAVSIQMGIAQDVWMYCIAQEECRAVSDQIDKLENIMRDKIGAIQLLEKELDLRIGVTIVIHAELCDRPEIVLSKKNVNFLASIHAEVGFDMYLD